jgi:L-threonylcarbamoyladenylate synthase
VNTKILNVQEVALAATLLRAGGLVAFPTETVYGLGADAGNASAVAKLYAAKGRPAFNPLIAHVASVEHAFELGVFSPEAKRLAHAFWPGPLTLVVPIRDETRVCALARAGLDSVAIRVPAHPVARRLLKAVVCPIVAPSANLSGHISPTRAEHVISDLSGRIEAVMDDGPCRVGVESTIISCLGEEGARLLRAGGVSTDALEMVLHHKIIRALPSHHTDALLAPGMLSSHYAPRAQVRLHVSHLENGEAVLLFGAHRPLSFEHAVHTVNLSESGDVMEAAANLFDALRQLDQTGVASIAVSPIPLEGLGEAINDRLQRAAADRG